MPDEPALAAAVRIASRCGISLELNGNGSLHRIAAGAISISLFPGNELEGGPANLYLRCRGTTLDYVPLLGPRSPTRFSASTHGNALYGRGQWRGVRYTLGLVVAEDLPAWSWHVWLENRGTVALTLDLICAQDIALAPYGMVRTNELYVSQYVDHTPLIHPVHGVAMASRQNLPIAGAHPWCIIASLHKACSFTTDALQLFGLAMRASGQLSGLGAELPGRRLQHEHSLVALQDDAVTLAPQGRIALGFVARFVADHPAATAAADLHYVEEALALASSARFVDELTLRAASSGSLFTAAPLLQALDLTADELTALFGTARRHLELADDGVLLSFFRDASRHVVLRAKELRVLRPHGHLLHTGEHLVPDEAALTSTVWMAGVFHSMLTQGHVSINRCVSTVRSYLGLFRSHGVRVFLEVNGAWQLLDVPSAFEMAPRQCRWFYKHSGGCIEVVSTGAVGHRLQLAIKVLGGGPARVLISHHLALDGDDGNERGGRLELADEATVVVVPDPASVLGQRFPSGRFRIRATAGTRFERSGADELLFLDGRSRGLPYACVSATGQLIGLELLGELIPATRIAAPSAVEAAPFELQLPIASEWHAPVSRLAEIAPWFVHNAVIHYLAPRGLEQYTGGGWGTRDVSQGPVELLLALGATLPVRDLLLRVMGAQNPDGDWPQWFMFFERERTIRAADSHGDIVFWPVLAVAQYLLASGDASLLTESVAFFVPGSEMAERASVWQHLERALQLIEQRRIHGTALAAYGHGDWNDSLQPADPAMRDHMCSAWTVTLHHQMLTTLARALRTLARDSEAAQLEQQARAVQADLQRLLLVDDVLAGYAVFKAGAETQYLLHPRDLTSGVRYSSLAMIHAILEGMLTREQAYQHLALIERHLSGPDGVRLFDRPLPYQGGPQRFFQRAESATFFGREIGLMYMHAHLRYAQALAHLGEAERFLRALCQVSPIDIREQVPTATLRQSNCYYSSSDAAFADRYEAAAEYQRIGDGRVALDGGWRVYSSGPGITVALMMRCFIGITQQATALRIDPVMPAGLDGLSAMVYLWDRSVRVTYRVRSPGCGVTSVQIGCRPLQLTYEDNPYRRGAALVARADVYRELSLASGTPTLQVSVGGP